MVHLRQFAPDALAALFTLSGALHLVRPSAYEALIPPFMPGSGAIIAVSGVAELICALGLVRRERWAGPASAGLLVAVFPGNVWFAIATTADAVGPSWLVVGSWLRLPLQVLLVWAAFQSRTRSLDRAPSHGQTPNDR